MLVSGMTVTAFADEGHGLEQNPTFSDAFDYAYENGIFKTSDYGDQTGDAYMQGAVTRGDYALYIARLNGVDLSNYTPTVDFSVNLTDMATCEDPELKAAVAWCFANNVTKGYSDGTFQPERVISREEICAMIARYYTSGKAEVSGLTKTDNLVVFTDSSNSTTNYVNKETVKYDGQTYTLLEFCVTYGLIQGKADGTFGFNGVETTRQQVMAILHRAGDADVAATTTKFYLGVKSGEGFVTAHVNDSYIMQVTVADANVDPSTVTLEAKMSNVASLGVGDEVREHSTTISTNIVSDGEADLGVWLDKCFSFQGCDINIDIAGKACAYNVSAAKIVDGNAVITFIPKDVAATRAAWHELTAHVETTTQATDDSYIVVAEGSYLTLGSETLEFEAGKGDLVLNNFSDMDALEAEIRDKVQVTTDAANDKIEAGIASGTALAVGSSIATLKDDATITVNGVGTDLVGDQLSSLRDAEGTYAMAKQLVSLVNTLVGTLNDGRVDVAISFE